MYRVMQAHGQDLAEGGTWSLLAEFDSMDHAQEFADNHYQTQVFTPSDQIGSCTCEQCSEGWRYSDYKAMQVEIHIQATAYAHKVGK